jgi:branched-chain amino acid aminotransferase group I
MTATRIAMWSGPRNISTAMMRSWGNRPDTFVCDEPLYAPYLLATAHTDHPGYEDTIRHHQTDCPTVVKWLTGPVPGGKSVFYQKHMAHHLLPEMDLAWVSRLTNCFLIRDPAEVLQSLTEFLPSPTAEETGVPHQARLFDYVCDCVGAAPPVIDTRDVLENPRGMLTALCERIDVPFFDEMLSWPAGPRDTDGAWAQYWYSKVYQTTGFAAYRAPAISLPPRLLPVLDEVRPLYERLHERRLRPAAVDIAVASTAGTRHCEPFMLQTFDERNRDLIVNISGRLLPRDEAGVSPFDSAVQGGDAVWEGLRLYQGRIFRLTEHLERLRRSAKALAFTDIPTHDDITTEIKRTLAANRMRDEVHIRLTLTRGVKITSGMDPRLNQSGPTLIVLAEFKKPVYDKSGLRLITSSYRRPCPDVLDPIIHHNNLLNSILAKIEASAAGADDALMLDARGFVAETNATHVFLVSQGTVATPRTVACPEGITRAVVLELCRANNIPCHERDVSLAEVHRADEVFCSGTMGELAPVIEVDGRKIGDGRPAPTYQRLAVAFHELTQREGTIIVD